MCATLEMTMLQTHTKKERQGLPNNNNWKGNQYISCNVCRRIEKEHVFKSEKNERFGLFHGLTLTERLVV